MNMDPQDDAEQQFNALDTDKSGYLDKEEFKVYCVTQLGMKDANVDKVTRPTPPCGHETRKLGSAVGCISDCCLLIIISSGLLIATCSLAAGAGVHGLGHRPQ
jgi:hypothetical protein